jgi:ssDNA-specific exonuclease RecJ
MQKIKNSYWIKNKGTVNKLSYAYSLLKYANEFRIKVFIPELINNVDNRVIVNIFIFFEINFSIIN